MEETLAIREAVLLTMQKWPSSVIIEIDSHTAFMEELKATIQISNVI